MFPDLRKTPTDSMVSRVKKALDADVDSQSEVRKRRSLGYATTRGTWVRIEVKDLARMNGQGWGLEDAVVLEGVAMPAWLQGVSWIDHDLGVMWRADETELITDTPIKAGGTLKQNPNLSESWWEAFRGSMQALAAHTTTRTATPHLHPVTQERITTTIHKLFPAVDATVSEWRAAHADLAWANLTAPSCYFFDWEDWGIAPRGWDAANLWASSFAVPELAERVFEELQGDLNSRTGKLAQLYHCAEILSYPPGYADELVPLARENADRLLSDLRS
ncbi:phosphotransferase [Actinosynnema sp. CS-041913]|uniref:phosphotransferase n=1 Tax=Actinosynnema sp. CS-041913 TaxID=3239917 RepID=UPI003D8E6C2E